jgi:hypothetical protein
MLVLIVLCLCIISTAEVFEGRSFSIDSWRYLARFRFVHSTNGGRVQFNITYEKGSKPSLVFYNLDYSGWDNVYKSKLTCDERLVAGVASRRILFWENHMNETLPTSCSPAQPYSDQNICSWEFPSHVNVTDSYACSGKQYGDCAFSLNGNISSAGLFRKAGITLKGKHI